jgi:hypothetical protein
MAKATIEALLARKDKDVLKTKEVHVPALDMDLVVEKKPLSVVAGFFDDMRADMSFSKSIEIYKELIYTCVPLFHDKKLQEAYNCAEPYDVVPAVFDDNVMAIQALGNEILSLYGFDELIQQVKN